MLTYWLSWDKIIPPQIKNLIREIFLPTFLFLLIGLFWFFQGLGQGGLNLVFVIFLFAGSLYWYIRARQESLEFLIFLSIFLGFFTLYNFQLAFFLSPWLAELLFFIFTFLLFIYLAYEKRFLQNSFLFALGLSIGLLQVFFVLSFWPTNPLSKSFILTSLFYTFWFVVVKKEKYLKYLVAVAVVLILVIATTRWPIV